MKVEEAIAHANIAANEVDEATLKTWEDECKVVSIAFLASLRANGFVVVELSLLKELEPFITDNLGRVHHDLRARLAAAQKEQNDGQ